MTAEEFHSALQEATNYSLKGFVLPHLKQQLPSLQRDLSNAARTSNQVSFFFFPRKRKESRYEMCSIAKTRIDDREQAGLGIQCSQRSVVVRYRLELYYTHAR